MRHVARFAIALASAALFAGALTSVAQASFGVTESNFEAGTCTEASCTYATKGAFYTQAAGHPPFGITAFELNHKPGPLGEEPEGAIKRVRVDIPPGLAADPEALPQCSDAEFSSNSCPAGTKVGTNELIVYDGVNDLTIDGTVYNLEQKAGLPLDFGIDVAVEPLVNVHIFLEGHVSWSTDYHEYFEINNIPKEGELAGLKVPLAVLKSKLIFEGQKGNGKGTGNFLTLPSVCSTSTTSHLEVESYEGAISRTETHTPVGVEGCGKVPFEPTAEVIPATGTAGSDEPDGATTDRQGAPERGRERNQHGRHPGRARDVARRIDAEPLGRTRARGMHAGGDRASARRIQSACPPASKSERSRSKPTCPRVRSRAPCIWAVPPANRSRPSVHDLPRCREQPGRVRAGLRVRSTRTRAQADWKPRSRTTPSFRSANCVSA